MQLAPSAGKLRASKTRLVLVLHLIGWEIGANFVNQSVMQNQSKRAITFCTQLKTALSYEAAWKLINGLQWAISYPGLFKCRFIPVLRIFFAEIMGQIHEGWDGVFYCGLYFNVQISQTSREQDTLFAYALESILVARWNHWTDSRRMGWCFLLWVFNILLCKYQTSREQHTLYAYDAQNRSLLLSNSIKFPSAWIYWI